MEICSYHLLSIQFERPGSQHVLLSRVHSSISHCDCSLCCSCRLQQALLILWPPQHCYDILSTSPSWLLTMLSFWTVCYYQMDCSTPSYLKYFKHSMLHGMSRWLAFYQRRVKQGALGLGPTSLTTLEINQSLGILQYSMPQILKSKLHQKSYMSISFPNTFPLYSRHLVSLWSKKGLSLPLSR